MNDDIIIGVRQICHNQLAMSRVMGLQTKRWEIRCRPEVKAMFGMSETEVSGVCFKIIGDKSIPEKRFEGELSSDIFVGRKKDFADNRRQRWARG